MKIKVIILLLLVLGFLVYFMIQNANTKIDEVKPTGNTGTTETTTPPVFSWRYTEANSLNPDGNPQTNLFLDATYTDGQTKSKLISVENGSCNALPEPGKTDADMLGHTTIVQCYYAGQGFLYKIVRGEHAYQILQKEFEEGSPEYIPPEQEYKFVAEFPF
jgi:hypothetical protein